MKLAPGEVLTAIEKQLHQLWSEPLALGEGTTRVCIMNLVVVSEDAEVAERYMSVVDEVSRQTPARVILVSVDKNATEDDLSGDVSAVCSVDGSGAAGTSREIDPHGGGQRVCSERVRLFAKGRFRERIASTVGALVVPELPTALVWLGRVDTKDPVFLTMAELATRIILDTEYTSVTSLLRLAAWRDEEPGAPHIADLAWTRLEAWQELCAQFFDDASGAELASGIERMTIAQATDATGPLGSEATLLTAWFATRLGWTLAPKALPNHAASPNSALFHKPQGGTVEVALTAVTRPKAVAPKALARFEFVAKTKRATLTGRIERHLATGDEPSGTSDADVLAWSRRYVPNVDASDAGEAESVDAVVRPSSMETQKRVRLDANKGALVLERTLRRPATDPLFESAVRFARAFFESRSKPR